MQVQPAQNGRTPSADAVPHISSKHSIPSRNQSCETSQLNQSIDCLTSPKISHQDVGERSSVPPPLDPTDDTENGFNESTFIGINTFTKGTEFYGPTAELTFLLQLRSLATAHPNKHNATFIPQDVDKGQIESPVTVDELYPQEDTCPEDEPTFGLSDFMFGFAQSNVIFPNRISECPKVPGVPSLISPGLELEKECMQLYFANLHVIYPFIDKTIFLQRCQKEIWEPRQAGLRLPLKSRSSRFPALYSAALSLGALTAGDDALSIQDEERVGMFLFEQPTYTRRRPKGQKSPRPSLELAHFLYTCARKLLGDVFESSSLESTQTILLMSIYNHYSLKPHAAYMYNALAARTAFAMGSTHENNLSRNSIEAITTWWYLYSHEMEVCTSLGRETFLREPSHYPIFISDWKKPLPPQFAAANDPHVFFGRAMTALALILRRTSDSIYSPTNIVSTEAKSVAAMDLDAQLLDWRNHLAPMYDLDMNSLKEQESTTKRKIMLKLRFYSARMLVHRSFLVDAAFHKDMRNSPSIQLCIDAADNTIDLLYNTLMNRPFFRTWFYNIMYAFKATVTILCVLVSGICNDDKLSTNVEKALTIFDAMDISPVAQKCARRTRGILELVKTRAHQKATTSQSRDNYLLADLKTPELPADYHMGDFVENEFLHLINLDVMDVFGSDADIMGSEVGSSIHGDSAWHINLS